MLNCGTESVKYYALFCNNDRDVPNKVICQIQVYFNFV